MTTYERHRLFLDRTGATLNCSAGTWQCSLGAPRLTERASTANRAVDALRRASLSPLVRVPISTTRWLSTL